MGRESSSVLAALCGLLLACHAVPPTNAPSPNVGAATRALSLSHPDSVLAALAYHPLAEPALQLPEQPHRFLLRTRTGARLLALVRPAQPGAIAHPRGIIVGHGSLPSDVKPCHRRPSFVVDFDRPEITALAKSLAPAPSLEALRSTVADHFTDEVHGQFLVASESAQQHAGDSTEHAVLAAALARALGIPARVVVGYALQPEASPPMAIGHVWTEVHDGQTWRTLDTSPLADSQREYLILGTLQDESSSYRAHLDQQMAGLSIDSVDAL